MTNILALPLVQITAVVGSDEDWIDAIIYVDATTQNPIDLTGISVTIDISNGVNTVTASTANGLLSLVNGPGSSVPNVLLVNIPIAIPPALTPGAYTLSGLATADGHALDVVVGSLTVRQSF